MCRLLKPNDLLRRLLAAGGVGLVLALTVFSASPTAHAWLHHGDHPTAAPEPADEHSCAVVLFASGVAVPVDAIPLQAPVLVDAAKALPPATELDLVSPRYLWQPERGPPVV